MARRIHVPDLRVGELVLATDQAHHARDVLRLRPDDAIELFDAAGNVAEAIIARCDERGVSVIVRELKAVEDRSPLRLTVAAAVPKGDRADWMVEKLSELGVDRFIPLAAARSVVLPGGRNKRERWMRLATESAKQSRRRGVMEITELTPLDDAIREAGLPCWCLSTAPDARPIRQLLIDASPKDLALFIGPEGGWTDDELRLFGERGAAAVSLTPSVLRVETAAVAAAAVVMSVHAFNPSATP